MVSDVGLEKRSKWTFSVYMYDNPTEETGVSLPTSVNERASDTTNKMAGPSFVDNGPSIDWSTDDNLYNCFKMWKHRYELLPGRWRKLKKKSNASIYYTGRESTEWNFLRAGTCPRDMFARLENWKWGILRLCKMFDLQNFLPMNFLSIYRLTPIGFRWKDKIKQNMTPSNCLGAIKAKKDPGF